MSSTDTHISKISKLLGDMIHTSDLVPDEDLLASGKLTSLTSMNLIMAIEEEFGIRIPNHELNRANFSTLRALAAMVERVRQM